MRVAVGLSGGVDSTVAALLLKQEGHEVIGITMSIWRDDPRYKVELGDACFGPNKKQDIEQVRKLAELIGIDYQVVDCSQQYHELVLDYFRNEYLAGHTPNPCVFCNSRIKFGVLIDLAKQSSLQFDKFATGHYANIQELKGRHILKKAVDKNKDQTYFLYRLKQEQLANILFPLGGLTKETVRKIAKENNLPVSDKPDSQDFYGGDYSDILCVPDKPGNIVDTQGKILGQHTGYWHYTIGQRRGLGIAAERPLYVLELEPCKNEVVVGYEEEALCSGLIAENLNWLISEKPEKMSAFVKIRSMQKEFSAEIIPRNADSIEVHFAEPQKAVTKGQSVVVYDGEYVVGGGIITEAL